MTVEELKRMAAAVRTYWTVTEPSSVLSEPGRALLAAIDELPTDGSWVLDRLAKLEAELAGRGRSPQ